MERHWAWKKFEERKVTMRKILICFVLIFMVGCAGPPMAELTEQARMQNRQKLTHLSIGMSKSEVLEIMGTKTMILKTFNDIELRHDIQRINNPYRVEAIKSKDGETYEILFYYTDMKKRDGVITDDELTPLVIKNDKLIGWGWTFVNDNIRKYQIDIRQ